MRRLLSLAFISIIALAGCQQEPPEPAQPEAPPPPTCEEVYQELKRGLAPLYAAVHQNLGIEDPAREAMVASFAQMRAQHSATENGPCGLEKIASDMTDLIREAKEYDRWRAVKGACQIYRTVRPGDTRHAEDERRADLIMARPIVRSRGFFESDGYLYAFLEVLDRDTGRITTYRVREGEEFHDILRLERIIGNQQKVEIWYEPLGDTWEVLSPKELNTTRGGRVSGR